MTLEKAKDKQQNSTVALRCIIYVTKLWNCISFKHISVTLERNYTVYWVYKPPVFQFPLSGLWSTEAQIIKPPMWISITLNVVLDEVTGINAKVCLRQTSNTHFPPLWNSYNLTNNLKWHTCRAVVWTLSSHVHTHYSHSSYSFLLSCGTVSAFNTNTSTLYTWWHCFSQLLRQNLRIRKLNLSSNCEAYHHNV